MQGKKTINPEEIMSIIRDHFEKGISIEDLSNRSGESIERISGWINKLFKDGVRIFDEDEKSALKKIKELEKNLKMRDRVLKEIFLINK